jgi:hypothetical protein
MGYSTLAKLVAKFATYVVDTGGAPCVCCEYLREFSNKFKTVLMGYSGAGGKLIHEKTRSRKSHDTVPVSYTLQYQGNRIQTVGPKSTFQGHTKGTLKCTMNSIHTN